MSLRWHSFFVIDFSSILEYIRRKIIVDWSGLMNGLLRNKYIIKTLSLCLAVVIIFCSNGICVFAQNSATYTITTSASEGGSITSTCKVLSGSDKNITVSINEGYEISSFIVDGKDAEIKNNTYTFTNVNADHSVVVKFRKKTFSVNMNAEGNGKITGVKSVEYGSSSVYTFVPDYGYELTDVTVDGEHVSLSEGNTYTLTNVREPHDISATFEEIICTVNIETSVNGSFAARYNSREIEDGEVVKYGSVIRLENTPDEFYTFEYYDINGEHITSDSYKVVGPVSINAVFTEKIYNINSTVSSNGTVTFGGNTTVAAGEPVTIEAHPGKGYEVESMIVNGNDVTEQIVDNTYTTDDTWSGLNVSVKFRKMKYTIETSCNAGGIVTPSMEVEYDNNVIVSFLPDEGYRINAVYVDGVILDNPGDDYAFNDIDDSHSIYVEFAIMSYDINVTSNGNGYVSDSDVVDYGGQYILQCIPDEGYQLDKVLVNGSPVNIRNNSYTISGIKKDYNISVLFKVNEIAKVNISKVSSVSQKSLKLSWKEIENAQGYEIYRKSETESSYRFLKRVALSYGTQTYIDEGLTAGKTYNYKIRAYKVNNGQYLYGSFSDARSSYPRPVKVNVVSVQAQGVSAMNVNWKRIPGVSGYELYVSSNRDGKYVHLVTLSGSKNTSYTHLKCKKGKTYYYKVRAYRNVSGQKVYGSYGNVKSGTTACVDTVTRVKAVKEGLDYVLLSWKRVKDADGYDIMWCAAKHGKYEKMATLNKSKSTYKDKFYQPGCNYYKIRAYRYVDGKKMYSGLSEVCGAYVTIRK